MDIEYQNVDLWGLWGGGGVRTHPVHPPGYGPGRCCRKCSVGKTQIVVFHLLSNWISRKFFVNGKQPLTPSPWTTLKWTTPLKFSDQARKFRLGTLYWENSPETMMHSACVASVSVWFRSKEIPRKGTFGFDRARNETRAKK